MARNNSNYNVCFVFKGDIFESNAPVNRTLSLVKGLKKVGVNVFIYGIVPLKEKGISSVGNINSIPYSYPRIKSKMFLIRSVVALFCFFYRYPRFIRNNKIDLVHSYGSPIIFKYLIFMFRLFFHYKVVEENNEFPHILLRKRKRRELLGKYQIHFAYLFLEGMIVINKRLMEYYKGFTSNYTKFEIINMTVDMERFSIPYKRPEYDNYLAYCGSFSQKKDGVLTLIEAFSKVRVGFPHIKLLLIGEGTKNENKIISQTIEKYKLNGNVILVGVVCRDEIPRYLLHSIGMILPRPNSLQAEGGFPTKLGEYLASGRPVVATSVGEIPEFLVDGVNAYLAEADSTESLYLKICEMLNDEQKANNIGAQGRELANISFSNVYQARKLFEFYKSL